MRRLRRYSEPVTSTAVSPDGTLVAVQRQAEGAHDSHVEVRDLRSDETLYTHSVRFGLSWSNGGVQFSGDGRTLVATGCCRRGSAVVGWDARSGAQRFDSKLERRATALAISPDARTLAVGTEDGNVILLRMSIEKCRPVITESCRSVGAGVRYAREG